MDGLEQADFELLVDRLPVRFDIDTTVQPLALVVAVQTNAAAAAAISKIRRMGSLIEPLLTGDRGQAAVLTFDDELRQRAPFTSDGEVLARTFRGMAGSGTNSRLIDAVEESIRLLKDGPRDRRRVILLIGESRDRGSKAELSEVSTLAQRENVSVYFLTYSPFLSQWAVKPNEIPPAGYAGGNLIAIFSELARLGKDNAADAFTRFTGGRRIQFLQLRGLEQAVTAIGEELYSQYLLSFTPPAEARGDFHPIEVRVRRAGVTVRTRPGYWLSGP